MSIIQGLYQGLFVFNKPLEIPYYIPPFSQCKASAMMISSLLIQSDIIICMQAQSGANTQAHQQVTVHVDRLLNNETTQFLY